MGRAARCGYLVLVYLAAVTLLGSYRTGLKVALWQSLMLLSVFYAQKDGILQSIGNTAADEHRVVSAGRVHLRAVDADA